MKRRPKYLLDALKERDRRILELDGARELYEGRENDPATRALLTARYNALDAAFNAVDRAQARYKASQEN